MGTQQELVFKRINSIKKGDMCLDYLYAHLKSQGDNY